MSQKVLELLRAISLLENDNSVTNLEEIPELQLKQRLKYYYEKRKEGANHEFSDLIADKPTDSALISSISANNAVIPLCPKFLVRESLIANDPLLNFGTPKSEASKVHSKGLGIKGGDPINRNKLANRLSYFSALAPYIEAGFLHILPLELLHEAPQEIPINFPKNLYRDLVPPHAIELVNKAAIVRPIQKTVDGLIVLESPNTQRLPNVCITFDGDDSVSHSSFYNYRDWTVEGENPDGSFRMSAPAWSDAPMNKAQYEIWIEQSVNKTIGSRLESISKEMRIADTLGAPYLTESTFEAGLLARSSQASPASDLSAVKFLQANANLLNLGDPMAIFRLRTDNAALMNRFRLSIAAVSEELKGSDGQDFDRRARLLFEKEIQPQIAEMNAVIGRLEGAGAKGLIQTGAALVLGLLTGPTLPVAALLILGAAGIAGEALPAIGDYQRARKQPQFIWHKLKK